MLAGGKEREEKGRERIHSPLLPCMRVPEWNSLFWLVESVREEKGRWIIAFLDREKQELSRFSKCPS
jgi:hypothetical protein